MLTAAVLLSLLSPPPRAWGSPFQLRYNPVIFALFVNLRCMNTCLAWSVDSGEEASDRAQDSRTQRPVGASYEGRECRVNENGESHMSVLYSPSCSNKWHLETRSVPALAILRMHACVFP